MIQRIQSLYLLLAAIAALVSCVLFATAAVPCYTGVVLMGLTAVFSLLNIFGYRNRRRQIRLCWLCMAFVFVFYIAAVALYNLEELPFPVSVREWLALGLPAVADLFTLLASLGIQADERLVRSIDRIR